MQPDDTCLPMVEGSLVPWMRYSVPPSYMFPVRGASNSRDPREPAGKFAVFAA